MGRYYAGSCLPNRQSGHPARLSRRCTVVLAIVWAVSRRHAAAEAGFCLRRAPAAGGRRLEAAHTPVGSQPRASGARPTNAPLRRPRRSSNRARAWQRAPRSPGPRSTGQVLLGLVAPRHSGESSLRLPARQHQEWLCVGERFWLAAAARRPRVKPLGRAALYAGGCGTPSSRGPRRSLDVAQLGCTRDGWNEAQNARGQSRLG